MELSKVSRSTVFKCQLCGADFIVRYGTSRLTCPGCQAEIVVERKHRAIALKIIAKSTNTTKSWEKSPEALSLGQLMKRLGALREESSTIHSRRSVVVFAGALFVTLFGSIGIMGLTGNEIALGITMSVCAAGTLWLVRFVRRDTAVSAHRIDEKIEEIEIQIAERQKLDIQRLAASNNWIRPNLS